TIGFDVPLDLVRVAGSMFDDVLADLLLATAEHQVVPGKIRMAEHMRGHQDIVGERVTLGHVGMTGVARKHHLEQTRIAHVPLDELVDVARAEGPVRHAHRQPVDGDLRHEAVGNRLEDDRRPLQAELASQLLEPRNVIAPPLAHAALPAASLSAASWVRKCRIAAPMSSGPEMQKRPIVACSDTSSNSRMVSVRTERILVGAISTYPA